MENRALTLAQSFVAHTGANVFLTGKAGTGKTSYLQDLKKTIVKQMIITAPTGVAAINAGGVTLHSFFQLPFGPFIPGSEAWQNSRKRLFRFSKEKKRIIQNLDLLVIDEISMVRADLLDSVDAVLRYHRRNDKPFGGVQLLMIGDLHQLPPVVKPDEWRLLQQYYGSAYFFSSHALDQAELITVELAHIYRQSDPKFIRLLNQVRNNRLDAGTIERLNRRYHPDFQPEEGKGYITLTALNNRAAIINQDRLANLPGDEIRYEAEVSGEFPQHTFPTPATLILKKGAQVMFLRNDTTSQKRYYNGKIGKIVSLSNEQVRIICPGETEPIAVDPVQWDNISYSLLADTNEIKETVIGSFKQFPLKLAWAITIHKSQGLTFDKAVIDAEAAFAHGQVYVALSRCRTLEGVVLTSPIPLKGITSDAAINTFIANAKKYPPSTSQLQAAMRAYQHQLLLACFDFHVLNKRLNRLAGFISGNTGLVQVSGIADLDRIRESAEEEIFSVGRKFSHQLMAALAAKRLPEHDDYIQTRTAKAAVWFKPKFTSVFNDLAENLQVETDNRELGKKINNALEKLRQEIRMKRAAVASCENGFSVSRYLRALARVQVDTQPGKKRKNNAPLYHQSDVAHAELWQDLKDWRSQQASQNGVAHFQILHQRVLTQIAVRLPDSLEDLEKINGIGKKTIAKYGTDLVDLVVAYRRKHGIKRVVLPAVKNVSAEKPAKQKKSDGTDTRRISLDMFNQGHSIARIMEERGLAESTITSHLCFFVEKGQLDIDRLLARKKQAAIAAVLPRVPDQRLKTIKQELASTISYNEIKLVLAHQKYLSINNGG